MAAEGAGGCPSDDAWALVLPGALAEEEGVAEASLPEAEDEEDAESVALALPLAEVDEAPSELLDDVPVALADADEEEDDAESVLPLWVTTMRISSHWPPIHSSYRL